MAKRVKAGLKAFQFITYTLYSYIQKADRQNPFRKYPCEKSLFPGVLFHRVFLRVFPVIFRKNFVFPPGIIFAGFFSQGFSVKILFLPSGIFAVIFPWKIFLQGFSPGIFCNNYGFPQGFFFQGFFRQVFHLTVFQKHLLCHGKLPFRFDLRHQKARIPHSFASNIH